jgi:aminopeptidase N
MVLPNLTEIYIRFFVRMISLMRVPVIFFLFFLEGMLNPASGQPPVCAKWLSAPSAAMTSQAQTDTAFLYDATYYECRWKVDPSVHFISGSVKVQFKPRVFLLYKLGLDLHNDLQVDSVTCHGNKVAFNHKPGHKLYITLPPGGIFIGVLDSVTVYYHGVPPKSERSFKQELHANTPIIWTLSEPYGAKDWWPCKQLLDDKADSIDIWVQVPKPNKVASNGLLAETIDLGSDYLYHWKHRYPIEAYLVAIGVTDYASFTDYVKTSSTDSFPILNYVYKEDSLAFRAPAIATVFIMKKFIEFMGPYPFEKEKYGHAQFGFGGGMEHQTMSFMKNLGFYLVAHELAHQWFGDKVTCESWEDLWLNEGFATMCEALIGQYLISHNEGIRIRKSQINRATEPLTGSVHVPDTLNVGRLFSSALTYAKGGAVLNMLRFTVGDSAFFLAIRNYLNDQGLAYSTARTDDLIYHLELVYGKSLGTFFEQWIYAEGYPIIDVHFSSKAGPLKITLTQKTTASWSVGAYSIPLPLRIWSQGVDTTLLLQLSSNTQEYSFSLPYSTIDSVQADPESWILAKFTVYDDDRIENSFKFRVFPNPAHDNLMIDLPDNNLSPDSRLQIIDVAGRVIKDWSPSETLSPEIRNFANGLYLVRYISNDTVYVERFIKK